MRHFDVFYKLEIVLVFLYKKYYYIVLKFENYNG
jgi:hypothetical protein